MPSYYQLLFVYWFMEFKWQTMNKPPISKINRVEEIQELERIEQVGWLTKIWYTVIKRPLERNYHYTITIGTETSIGILANDIVGIKETGLRFFVVSANKEYIKFVTINPTSNIIGDNDLLDKNLILLSRSFSQGN